MNTPSTRRWRSLVILVRLKRSTAILRVPSFSGQKPIVVKRSIIPDLIQEAWSYKGNWVFHAQVNIGAEQASDLVFSEWEVG